MNKESRNYMLDRTHIARLSTLRQVYSITEDKNLSQGEIVRRAIDELFDRSGHVIEAAAKKLSQPKQGVIR